MRHVGEDRLYKQHRKQYIHILFTTAQTHLFTTFPV
jgi:hypothetical protein